MKFSVKTESGVLQYTHTIKKHLKSVRLMVNESGDLIVISNGSIAASTIESFIQKKTQWIINAIEKQKRRPHMKLQVTKEAYTEKKFAFQRMIRSRLEFYNQSYNFSYNAISIRRQSHVWGSCSYQGNLQFNFALILLPQRLVDYVVVHELCHLKEHNHGPNFWKLVERTFSDHKLLRSELRKYSIFHES